MDELPDKPATEEEWDALEYTLLEFGYDTEGLDREQQWAQFIVAVAAESRAEPDLIVRLPNGNTILVEYKSRTARWDDGRFDVDTFGPD